MESAWCAAIHYSTAWSICNHPTLSLSLSFSLSPTLSLCFCLFLSATPAEIEFIGIGYWYYCFNDKWCDALRNTTLLILSTQPLPYPFVCWSMISQFCALRLRAAFFINDLLCFANNVNVRYSDSMKFFKIIRLIILCSIWILIKFQNCFIGG